MVDAGASSTVWAGRISGWAGSASAAFTAWGSPPLPPQAHTSIINVGRSTVAVCFVGFIWNYPMNTKSNSQPLCSPARFSTPALTDTPGPRTQKPNRTRIDYRHRNQTQRSNPQSQPTPDPPHPPQAAAARPLGRRTRVSFHRLTLHRAADRWGTNLAGVGGFAPWCGWRDSNPHGLCPPGPKPGASTFPPHPPGTEGKRTRTGGLAVTAGARRSARR